jgi:hypothetical protein
MGKQTNVQKPQRQNRPFRHNSIMHRRSTPNIHVLQRLRILNNRPITHLNPRPRADLRRVLRTTNRSGYTHNVPRRHGLGQLTNNHPRSNHNDPHTKGGNGRPASTSTKTASSASKSESKTRSNTLRTRNDCYSAGRNGNTAASAAKN